MPIADRDQRVLDAVYRTWGVDAEYVSPQGATTACRIIFMRDGRFSSTEPMGQVHLTGLHFDVAANQVIILVPVTVLSPEEGGVFNTGVSTGGVFTPDGRQYAVGGAPDYQDSNAAEWRCQTTLAQL